MTPFHTFARGAEDEGHPKTLPVCQAPTQSRPSACDSKMRPGAMQISSEGHEPKSFCNAGGHMNLRRFLNMKKHVHQSLRITLMSSVWW